MILEATEILISSWKAVPALTPPSQYHLALLKGTVVSSLKMVGHCATEPCFEPSPVTVLADGSVEATLKPIKANRLIFNANCALSALIPSSSDIPADSNDCLCSFDSLVAGAHPKG